MTPGQLALGAMVAGALAGTAWVALTPADPPSPPRPPPVAAAPTPPSPGLATPPANAPEPQPVSTDAPRFDVARVGARGMLVAAGRAAPHAEVTLLDGARELGRARADARGEWVILPPEPLASGPRELSLMARRPGGEMVRGSAVVVVLVPEVSPAGAETAGAEAATAPSGPLAVLLPTAGVARSEAPRLLQAPSEGPAAGLRGTRLGLDIVDYEEDGDIRFSGTAPPGATVRLYVGSDHLGDATSSQSGRWQLTPASQPDIGRHTLRVDQLATRGIGVAARIELPFQRERLPEAARDGQADLIVQPGQNLWRIARRVYGRGNRYTVIYDANRAQIRDPRLIYPGQVFAMPGASAPAASSFSR